MAKYNFKGFLLKNYAFNQPQCEIYWSDKQGNEFEVENLKISVISTEYIDTNLIKRRIQIEVMSDL